MLRDPDSLQPLARSLPGLALANTAAPETERDVLPCVEEREEEVVLEDDADRAPFGHDVGSGGRVVEHDVVESDVPRVELKQPGEDAKDRRLPRAVRAEDRDHLVV